MMKIAISTLAMYPQTLEEILPYLEDELKIDYCEIIHEYPLNEIDQNIFESYLIKPTVHVPISDMNISSPNKLIRNASVAEIKNSMDLANKIDANIVVVHPGKIPFLTSQFKDKILDLNYNSLKECANYANDLGLTMCVENMPNMDGYLFKDISKLDNLVNNLNVYMTLDVGHAHNCNFLPKDMLTSNRIKHIHLSDNDGSWDNHDALGQGTLDFEKLFKELKNINYCDILVIEVKNPKEVESSLDLLRNNFK